MIWHHLRGHGLPHMIGKGIDPKYFLAEHTGKETGMCRGVSSYHSCDPNLGHYGHAGSLGSNFSMSVGYGLTCKMNGRGQVVVSCFGDGTSNRGTLHEAFLMSNNWKLPIVWVCENNQLSMYVPVSEHHPMEHISSLAPGYGMPSEVVDGQDVIAVAEAVRVAVELARQGEGPTFVECITTRYHEHDIGMPDLVGTEPRTEEMIEKLRQRDPVLVCRQQLVEDGLLTEEDIEKIAQDVTVELEAAETFADESPVTDPAILDSLLYAEE
jgi:pyruvate dehydrogenase E1 component alpha subunit